jgi:ATP-binding cassette subfamily B multidrug efflux pump
LSSTARETNIRFFSHYILHHKRSYAVGIVLIFLTNWLAVSIPGYLGESIDLLSGVAQNQNELIHVIGIVIAFALAMVVTRTVSRILFFNPGRAIERELKDDAFAKLTHMQPVFYQEHESGTLISIVNNDVNGVRALAGIVMLQAFNIVFALSLTPLKMYQISPALTLYCVFPVLITFAIAHNGIAFMRKMLKVRMVELQEMSAKTVGFLSGIEVMRSHGIQTWAEKEFDQENVKIRDRSIRLAKVRTVVLPVIAYTDRLLKVLILAIGGGYLIKQQLTLGELTAFLSYASLLAMPFISLGMVLSAWQNGIVSLESLRRILDLPIHEQDLTHLPLDRRAQLFSKGIRVSNLSYSYPGSDASALSNVSFDISPGETLGILGKVGSGKSTLVNCLNRYLEVPAETVYIDDQDITKLARKDLRSAVRTITQDPFLFSDTVSENIQFGSVGREDPLPIEQALHQSDMLDEVQLFPGREETLVGEKGILLSGGQKQRLSLARGLYTPCKLMVLDNVLSAVDNETERFLLDQIFNNTRSASTLIVSHRATVLEKVDSILVLENGRIVARGSHQELLQSSDLYRQTWELQQRDGRSSV